MQRSGWPLRRTAAGAASAVLASTLAMLALLATPAPAAAQAQCAKPAAIVRTITNQVEVALASTSPPVAATRDMPVCPGATIYVRARSRALVLITASNTLLALDQNSNLEIGRTDSPTPNVGLLRGALLFITRIRRSFEVRTPFVNASVEGTEFVVRVGDTSATVTVLEGTVRAANEVGSLVLGAGQQAVAAKGQAPQLQVVVRPRDAVQWAVYYEPILPADTTLAQLDAVPAANQNAAFFVQRASLLLSVGQVEAARADLDQALKLNASAGDAYALRTITAVALNDKAQALENGRRAVELAPNSTAARLALSYALQADFQLEAARDVVSQAVMTSPNDAAAWARLAELRLMLDDIGGAADAAEQAVMLAKESSRPRVVLGFTQLAQLKLADAERTFEQALNVQPRDPLGHLGHGLTQIRRGRLKAGRSELETAVALNPEDALLRSYLGKAYFDERQEAQAERQFEVATRQDPNDPTPLFYSAIEKQSVNRPVEALADLQRAIDLNGARGVYRSQEQLNEDLAARAATLGQVYRDLGFEQRALLEGWRSLQADSGDYSGHRFLADMYSSLPRHEVARVSELLQAQLLQPLTVTHVSPVLAEIDLGLMEGAGPSSPSLNDFNPLFRRNRLSTQITGVIGGHDLLADEAVVSGLRNRVAFSAGQFHYETDGVRANNDQDRDIGNVFVQAELSPATMVQGEVRTERSRFGDLTLRFNPTLFQPNLRNEIDGTTTRLGARQTFSPRSQLIASFAVQTRDVDTHTLEVNEAFGLFNTVDIHNDTSGLTVEARHLYGRGALTFDYGGGFFRAERKRAETNELGFLSGIPGFRTESQFDDKPRQSNSYVYVHGVVVPRLTLTLGASVDHFSSTLFERNQFNPKVGASWSPIPSTTVRVAAFRSLTRAVVASQTVEPTQVAGFNQFFADEEGAESWRYGAAVDSRLGAAAFGGAEYTWRDLTIPVELVDPIGNREVVRLPRGEQFGRAYLYVAPERHVAASVEYLVERNAARVGSDRAGSGLLSLRSHRLPLTVNVFESRFFGRIRADYIRQSARYLFITESQNTDAFWMLGGRIGYRLPKRYGRLLLDVANLLDHRDFRYEAIDPQRPDISRDRVATLRFELGI